MQPSRVNKRRYLIVTLTTIEVGLPQVFVTVR
jgi:hypothetical protein